jgi:hypothetical protein
VSAEYSTNRVMWNRWNLTIPEGYRLIIQGDQATIEPARNPDAVPHLTEEQIAEMQKIVRSIDPGGMSCG